MTTHLSLSFPPLLFPRNVEFPRWALNRPTDRRRQRCGTPRGSLQELEMREGASLLDYKLQARFLEVSTMALDLEGAELRRRLSVCVGHG